MVSGLVPKTAFEFTEFTYIPTQESSGRPSATSSLRMVHELTVDTRNKLASAQELPIHWNNPSPDNNETRAIAFALDLDPKAGHDDVAFVTISYYSTKQKNTVLRSHSTLIPADNQLTGSSTFQLSPIANQHNMRAFNYTLFNTALPIDNSFKTLHLFRSPFLLQEFGAFQLYFVDEKQPPQPKESDNMKSYYEMLTQDVTTYQCQLGTTQMTATLTISGDLYIDLSTATPFSYPAKSDIPFTCSGVVFWTIDGNFDRSYATYMSLTPSSPTPNQQPYTASVAFLGKDRRRNVHVWIRWAILIILLIIFTAVVIGIVLCKKGKTCCFKQLQQEQPQFVHNNNGDFHPL